MLELNKIYNGDCMELFKQVDDNSVNLVVTSPPYNLGVKYDVYNDKMIWEEYLDWSRAWLKEAYRVLAPDGRFCLNHYLSCGTSVRRFAPLMDLQFICEHEVGFKHHGFGCWMDTTLTKRTAWGSWKSCRAPYVNCLHPSTPVFAVNGVKHIDYITSNDEVLTHGGNYKRVLVSQRKPFRGDIIIITSALNTVDPIKCTGEHKFLVKTETCVEKYEPTHHFEYIYSEPMWKTAEEINNEHLKQRVARRRNCVFYTAMPKTEDRTLPVSILKSGMPLGNETFWEFVGFWLAEGSLDQRKKRNYRVRISGNSNEDEYIKSLLQIFDVGGAPYYSKSAHAVTFHMHNKKVWTFLKEFYIDGADRVFGRKSHLKTIPEWCMWLPKNLCMAIVRGYLAGDGNIQKKRNATVYRIDSTSYNNIIQTQRLLFKCGIYATIYRTRNKGDRKTNGKTIHCREGFRLEWYDHKTRYKTVGEDDKYIWIPIKSVSKVKYDGYVCDLNVEIDHSFCIPCATTHNSPFEGILIMFKDHWKLDRKGESTISKEDFMMATTGIWKLPTERNREIPAPFPVALPKLCINLLTYEGDLVLDPFVGSGSTAVAAVETGRNYIGFELSPNYCRYAEERVIIEHAKNYAKEHGFTVDLKRAKLVAQGLYANELEYGARYCPCRVRTGDPEKDKSIICPCEMHVEDIEKDGHCKCHLFKRSKL